MTAGRVRLASLAGRVQRVLNVLLLLGLVVQFWAAGWAAFGMPFTLHALLGWSLIPVALSSAAASAVAHGAAPITRWALLIVLLLMLQPVFVFVLSGLSTALAALHPVNGLAAFCVAVRVEWLAVRSGRLLSAGFGSPGR